MDSQQSQKYFETLIQSQLARIGKMKTESDWIDYQTLNQQLSGFAVGMELVIFSLAESQRVMEFLLKEQAADGKIKFRVIEGLTIETRAEVSKAIPEDVLDKLKQCNVILKTTTPRKGDPWKGANAAMRKELELFANVRSVQVLKDGIDWVLFRENTEGAYALGSNGVNISDDLAIDFTVTTTQDCECIMRLAFEYADKNNAGFQLLGEPKDPDTGQIYFRVALES